MAQHLSARQKGRGRDIFMIKLSNVSKSYAKSNILAVNSLNLEVNPGEIFGFLGPNGAGKSTTIKMITGILRPDYGNITVAGYDLLNDPINAKLNLGYVPDNHAIYEKLKGIEYLNFIADVYGVSQEERKSRAEKYLKIFNLQDAANHLIKSYSHGMKQKLCIIGALIHQPRVWILDEPLTGLDPQSSYHLKELMKEHIKGGNTVFFSSHVLEVVEKLCDRVAIIDKGRLVAIGTVQQLTADSSLEKFFLNLTAGDNQAAEESPV